MIIYDRPHIDLPGDRSFWFPAEDLPVEVCPTCHGHGHHDSCFDCGNRGYTPLSQLEVDDEES